MDPSPSPAPGPPGTAPERRFVGVLHEFHDAAYARDWANRFTPSPSREALFATMLGVLEQHPLPHPRVLELGIGPAYFADSYRLLEPGGIFLNGDFVKPDDTTHDYEPGRFTVARHLELLAAAGFAGRQCLGYWEKELEAPTTAHNYACLLAFKVGEGHEGPH